LSTSISGSRYGSWSGSTSGSSVGTGFGSTSGSEKDLSNGQESTNDAESTTFEFVNQPCENSIELEDGYEDGDCRVNVLQNGLSCEDTFCPTCLFSGYCDLECGYCLYGDSDEGSIVFPSDDTFVFESITTADGGSASGQESTDDQESTSVDDVVDCASFPCAENEYCIEDSLTYTCINCGEGILVDNTCECPEGLRGTSCEIEYVSLALVLTMSYPENVSEFSEAFEAEMESTLLLEEDTVVVTSISSFTPNTDRRRLDEGMLLIEFEILLLDSNADAESITDNFIAQLNDPESALLSGSIGSAISTEYGLLVVSDDGEIYEIQQDIMTSSSTITTVSATNSIEVTGDSDTSDDTIYGSAIESDDDFLFSDDDDVPESTLTDIVTISVNTDTGDDRIDSFEENIIAVDEASNAIGVIIGVIVVAAVLVIVLVLVVIKLTRKRAQLTPIKAKKTYTITNDIENNAEKEAEYSA